MTTFTVWKFDSPDGAEQAASILKDAAGEGLVKIVDHAVVSWPIGAPRPATKQSHEETWHSTGWGALWGLVIGALPEFSRSKHLILVFGGNRIPPCGRC